MEKPAFLWDIGLVGNNSIFNYYELKFNFWKTAKINTLYINEFNYF